MNISNWKKLYALASEIKSLKPWEWMSEHDMFGVHDNHSGITGYISVMGKLGEHFAVTAYRGAQAVIDLSNLMDGPQPVPPDLFLEIPQLMLSFENQGHLEQKDRDLIKKLGLKFRGENAWPFFRSYKPGFVPYFLDDEGQRNMIVYLEQAVDILKQAKNDPMIIFSDDDETGEKFLVRRPVDEEGNRWEDHYEEIVSELPEDTEFNVEKEMYSNYKEQRTGVLSFELDFFMLNNPVIEKNQDPYFPYLLFLIERNSEMIIGFEILTPVQGFHAMLGEIPSKLLSMLSQQPSKPKEIHVQSERLYAFIDDFLSNLGVTLKLKQNLKILNGAKKVVEMSMG
jgi:hypothetical protein